MFNPDKLIEFLQTSTTNLKAQAKTHQQLYLQVISRLRSHHCSEWIKGFFGQAGLDVTPLVEEYGDGFSSVPSENLDEILGTLLKYSPFLATDPCTRSLKYAILYGASTDTLERALFQKPQKENPLDSECPRASQQKVDSSDVWKSQPIHRQPHKEGVYNLVIRGDYSYTLNLIPNKMLHKAVVDLIDKCTERESISDLEVPYYLLIDTVMCNITVKSMTAEQILACIQDTNNVYGIVDNKGRIADMEGNIVSFKERDTQSNEPVFPVLRTLVASYNHSQHKV